MKSLFIIAGPEGLPGRLDGLQIRDMHELVGLSDDDAARFTHVLADIARTLRARARADELLEIGSRA